MQTLESPSELIRVFLEAYHNLLNAAAEVKKFTYSIFNPRRLFITCEEVNKLLFYERVVKGIDIDTN